MNECTFRVMLVELREWALRVEVFIMISVDVPLRIYRCRDGDAVIADQKWNINQDYVAVRTMYILNMKILITLISDYNDQVHPLFIFSWF